MTAEDGSYLFLTTVQMHWVQMTLTYLLIIIIIIKFADSASMLLVGH